LYDFWQHFDTPQPQHTTQHPQHILDRFLTDFYRMLVGCCIDVEFEGHVRDFQKTTFSRIGHSKSNHIPDLLGVGANLDFRDFQKGAVRTTFFAQSRNMLPGVRAGASLVPTLAPTATQNGPRTSRDQMFIDFETISDGFGSDVVQFSEFIRMFFCSCRNPKTQQT
jgi:hypothetical protein